ncbi:MAG: TrkA family potassium uptake protein [Chloroflexi bacterium]|nr:TrkA family potassium uptake protein [Chloroflexota bacterium]MXY85159.1 TrkA family potassium uptake protein [Chloroflexota bacterium]MYJ58038.1 TrkA family potassium uptake protein [Chloroflexota bacterium]
MRVVIMGCGRLGSTLARELDHEGHDVTVIDIDAAAFNWLEDDFTGITMIGAGEDVEVQQAAGVPEADVFLALANGDNRNAMAVQVAKHIHRSPRVVARIYDPERADVYRQLGINVVNPTTILDQMVREAAFAIDEPNRPTC